MGSFSRDKPSPAYTKALAEASRHHAGSKTFSGKFLRPQKEWLGALIAAEEIRTVLDFGAGKGEQYSWRDPEDGGRTLEEAWGVPVTKYDPAWPPYSAFPEGSFDLVISTFTLGCIPVVDLSDWVLPEIVRRADKAVFIMEALGAPKKKVFSDPQSLPRFSSAEQWLELIRPHARDDLQIHLAIRRRGTAEGTQIERHVL